MHQDNRIRTAFHETFRLERSRLAEVLKVASAKHPLTFVTEDLREPATSLGPNMVPAFVNYGIGSGLIARDGPAYRLTTFGSAASNHDPNLALLDTQWLLHYHLSAPSGPGPAFWHQLFGYELQVGVGVVREHLASSIALVHKDVSGKALNAKTAATTASVFVNSYVSPDGLGRLGLFERTEGNGDGAGVRLVGGHTRPSSWVVGFAVIDWWQRTMTNQITVGLERLYERDGLATFLFLDRAGMEDALADLQSAGVLDVYRVAPPFQVVRRWKDDLEIKTALLEQAYAGDAR